MENSPRLILKVRKAELAASAVRPAQYPEEALPQIALFGRSNAGKSSLINALIDRKNLARTSSAPGKTRLLNFYRVEGRLCVNDSEQPCAWYFVDLPGYGYAKVSKSERENWLGMMEQYLNTPAQRQCWQLMDIRHLPSAEDQLMRRALTEAGFAPLLIANKADKLGRSAQATSLRQIAAALGESRSSLVAFSAVTRQGKEELLLEAAAFLAAGWADDTGSAESPD